MGLILSAPTPALPAALRAATNISPRVPSNPVKGLHSPDVQPRVWPVGSGNYR